MSFYIYQSAIGGEKKTEVLISVCIYGILQYSWFGVWWWCFFSASPKRKKVQLHFFQFSVHINVELFIYAFIHLCLVQIRFYLLEENGYVKYFSILPLVR